MGLNRNSKTADAAWGARYMIVNISHAAHGGRVSGRTHRSGGGRFRLPHLNQYCDHPTAHCANTKYLRLKPNLIDLIPSQQHKLLRKKKDKGSWIKKSLDGIIGHIVKEGIWFGNILI